MDELFVSILSFSKDDLGFSKDERSFFTSMNLSKSRTLSIRC